MQNSASPTSQFTLRELLFATAMTFVGMAVLNTVAFNGNPALGCVVALISTIAAGGLVIYVSAPNSIDRFFLLPIVFGGIVGVFAFLWNWSSGYAPEFLVGLLVFVFLPVAGGVGVSILLLPRHMFAAESQYDRAQLVLASSGFLAFSFAVLACNTLCTRCRTPSTETAAAAACKAYAEAQEIYHRTDYDRDGVLEYAQSMFGPNSLLENKEGAQDILMIDPAFAEAAWEYPNRVAKAGYFYKVLHAGGCRIGSYIDDKGNQTIGYAMLAVPAAYDITGRDSFVIDSTGTIYRKDLGPETLRIADGISDFMPDATWTLCE